MNMAVTPFKWTDDVVEVAAEMWNSGKTARDISETLGISRNAVISKANRDKKRFKVKGRVSNGRKPRPAGEAPRRRIRKASPSNRQREKIVLLTAKAEALALERGQTALPEPTDYDNARLEGAKTLLDLGKHDCRWPLNNGGPFLFCAEATEVGCYCLHHALRSVSTRQIEMEASE